MDGQFLQHRERPFEGKQEGSMEKDNDLDDRGFNNDVHEERLVLWCLQSSGITESSTDEVPEELAIEAAPVTSPNCVNTRRNGNQTRPVMPDEVAHC